MKEKGKFVIIFLMKIIKFDKFQIKKIKIAKEILAGKTVVLPFDTVYGLVANPFSETGMKNLYAIKGRDFNKPIALIFSDVKGILKYVKISKEQFNFMDSRLPGPFTFLLKIKSSSKKRLSSCYKNLKLIGVRVPNQPLVLDLVSTIGQPIAATSANISGGDNCWSVNDFLQQIKNSDTFPNFIVDAGKIVKNQPSKIFDLSDIKKIKELR